MLHSSHVVRHAQFGRRTLVTLRAPASTSWQTGRAGPYRRITSQHHGLPADALHTAQLSSSYSPFRPHAFSTTTRASAVSFRDLKSESKAEKPKTESTATSESSPDPLDPAEQAYQAAKKQSDKEREKFKARVRKEKERQEAKGNEGKSEESEKKQEKESQKSSSPPPSDGRTPLQVFMDTLKTEFKASKEWNESTKALSDGAHQFSENEQVKRARAAYTAASGAATSGTATAIKGAGRTIGAGAAWTWDTQIVRGVRQGVNATGRAIDTATKPVRETQAFKSVKDVIDDGSSSKYGGWMEKEERRKQRELRELEEAAASGRPGRARVEKMEEDPGAGTNVTLHKDSKFKESWRNFKDTSRVMQGIVGMRSAYEESENPLISTARSITDRVAGFFAENETAMVIKKFREMDPSFQVEPFVRDMREYILPEVLDAYVKGDTETLKLWLSAAQYQVYAALAQQYTTAGLKSDGRVLDIRHVDIASARILEPGEIPVFIVSCRTQEVHVYRNAKTNELAAGMEDKVQLVTYAIGVTRLPDEVNNPDTRGWRLIELQKSARDYI